MPVNDHQHCDDPCCDGCGMDREQITQMVRERMQPDSHTVVIIAERSGHPQLGYTVGVHAFVGYEFAMSGRLGKQHMYSGLNKLALMARDGSLRPSDGLLVEGVFASPFLPRLRLARPGWDFPLITRVQELEQMPPVWQAQWPSPNQFYPGDDAYTLPWIHQADFSVEPAPAQGQRA